MFTCGRGVDMGVCVTGTACSHSGCPEAIKLLVGNKCDLQHDMDLTRLKVGLY